MTENNIMEMNNDGLFIKNIGVVSDDVNPEKFYCVKGNRQFDRFFYVISGTIFFNKGTKDYLEAGAGTILYLPSDIEYVSEWDESQKSEYISVTFFLEDSTGKHIEFSDSIEKVLVDSDLLLLKKFQECLEIYRTKSGFYSYKLQSVVFEIIYRFLKARESEQLMVETASKSIYKSIMYLERHFTENISIKEIAAISNVSEPTFRRLFKNCKNVSPIEYRTKLRLEKAKQFLASGIYTVGEIAYIIGYYDVASFSKIYKKHYGYTPLSEKRR